MIELKTPNGLAVSVPQTDSEDKSPKFTCAEVDKAKSYYDENGYVVLRSVVSDTDCSAAMSLWQQELKSSRRYVYRQATAKAEKNVLNNKGWVMNPILNLQSISPKHFPMLREHAVARILTADRLTEALACFLGDEPKIVQSMYFEGNSATWEHQDSYYLDSERIGSMVACWIALEDISATAGRFFICPGSQNLDLGKQRSETNIADNHDVYIAQVVQNIRDRGLEIRAPKLDRGDVLLWNAWTIHGSLASEDEQRSRSSITCHVIPKSDKFLQLHSRSWMPEVERVNGAWVWRPKDQAKIRNRLILSLESYFPDLFYFAKKIAVRHVVERNEQ